MNEMFNVATYYNDTPYPSDEYLATVPDGALFAVMWGGRWDSSVFKYSVFIYQRTPLWRYVAGSQWCTQRYVKNNVFMFRWRARRWARKQLRKNPGGTPEMILEFLK